jgi:hypothetical protein
MTIVKTILEFPYQPADFFESPYRQATPDREILVGRGIVTVTLSRPQDPVPQSLKSRIASEIEALFYARQLRTHRRFEFEHPRTNQLMSDGTKAVGLTRGDIVVATDTVDVIVADSTGKVIRDSKAEHIAEDTRFVDELAPKISRSPLLQSLLASYSAAVNDPADELTHLYEIRDALAKHYGSEAKACSQLGISKPDWKRLGDLANAKPIAQSRHRGRHLSGIRPATQAELEEARQVARRLILAFAKTI